MKLSDEQKEKIKEEIELLVGRIFGTADKEFVGIYYMETLAEIIKIVEVEDEPKTKEGSDEKG